MGADIDARNVDDQTPLHLSCMSGHLETAKWLVDNNADLQAMDNFQRYNVMLPSILLLLQSVRD